MPRYDLTLLLFNAREDLCRPWEAAEAARGHDERLAAAVDRLRPILGERERR